LTIEFETKVLGEELEKFLEKCAVDNEDAHFIQTEKGKLVLFNPDRFVWNAYGKESLDSEKWLTDEQWNDFISSEDYLYLELNDAHHQAFYNYCKNNKIKMEDDLNNG